MSTLVAPSIVSAPDVFRPALDRLAADLATRSGLTDVRLVPVHYEERLFSHVLRVTVHSTESPIHDSVVWVKVSRPKSDVSATDMMERVRRDFVVTDHVYKALLPWGDLAAVKPLACYPELLTIVTEEAPGITLLDYLVAHARWFPGEARLREITHSLESIGRWLKAFQQIDATEEIVALDELLHYVSIRLDRLVSESESFTAEDAARVRAHMDALVLRIPREELREVPLHGDLAVGNVLVSDDRIVVLDLAMMRRGARVHDIARLSMQLDLLRGKPAFRPRTVRALQEALLRGFDPSLTPENALFRLTSVLHRINNLSTLLLREVPLPTRLYNARLIRMHRRWLDAELRSLAAVG